MPFHIPSTNDPKVCKGYSLILCLVFLLILLQLLLRLLGFIASLFLDHGYVGFFNDWDSDEVSMHMYNILP